MFSQQQVFDEVRRIRAGAVEPHNSRVYDAWMEMAGDWFVQDDGEYLRNGFVGFNQRSPEIILLDFHLGGKLAEPLTDEQVDEYYGASRK